MCVVKFPNICVFSYIPVNSYIHSFMVRENAFYDFSSFGFVWVCPVLVTVLCILEKKAYSAGGGIL